MCIYCGTTKYRKIYENHVGSIPKDEDGRTYEIHHIDGNRKNNDPTNLVALSIQEHHDIHRLQGDNAACLLLAERMKLSADEKSKLARAAAMTRVHNGTHHFLRNTNGYSLSRSRVENGTHNLLTREAGTSVSGDRVENGTHHFLGGEISRAITDQRMKDGTHHFLESDWQRNNQLTRIENGSHPFSDSDWCSLHQRSRVENGTHNLLGSESNLRMLAEGKHSSQKQWTCEHCEKTGFGTTNYKRWHGVNCKKVNHINR